MSETTLVICNRKTGAPSLPNCRASNCSKCHSDVWVTRGTLLTVTGLVFDLICCECAFVLLKDVDKKSVKMMPVSGHQLSEMPQEFRAPVQKLSQKLSKFYE